MSMHSLMFLMIALICAAVVVGGLLAVFRVVGAREVDSDHARR